MDSKRKGIKPRIFINHFHSLYLKNLSPLRIVIYLILYILIIQNTIVAKNRFCEIFITNRLNDIIVINVEIADTVISRTKGLQFRKTLDKNHGMLFVFKSERKCSFWMKNTYIPLSIAYIDSNGRINEIYTMKPRDTSITYSSSQPALYALEVNKGWFKKNNITVGCRISFNGCLGK